MNTLLLDEYGEEFTNINEYTIIAPVDATMPQEDCEFNLICYNKCYEVSQSYDNCLSAANILLNGTDIFKISPGGTFSVTETLGGLPSVANSGVEVTTVPLNQEKIINFANIFYSTYFVKPSVDAPLRFSFVNQINQELKKPNSKEYNKLVSGIILNFLSVTINCFYEIPSLSGSTLTTKIFGDNFQKHINKDMFSKTVLSGLSESEVTTYKNFVNKIGDYYLKNRPNMMQECKCTELKTTDIYGFVLISQTITCTKSCGVKE